eukprot:365351-Chlamydomonas_euryale.AAC.1
MLATGHAARTSPPCRQHQHCGPSTAPPIFALDASRRSRLEKPSSEPTQSSSPRCAASATNENANSTGAVLKTSDTLALAPTVAKKTCGRGAARICACVLVLGGGSRGCSYQSRLRAVPERVKTALRAFSERPALVGFAARPHVPSPGRSPVHPPAGPPVHSP